jgi:hypothetical protein
LTTSELIKILQDIAKTVPFDADVVDSEFGPWTNTIKRVYHDPPVTIIEFERDED